MTDHKEIILSALEDIPGLGSVSDAWPDAETALPAIVVSLAGKKTADRRDDKKYIIGLEYYLRFFATTSTDNQTMFHEAESRMEALGYECTYEFDQDTAGAKQYVTRFTKTIPA